MARKVTRKTKGVRRQARAQGTSRRVRTARNKGQSIIGRLLSMLPFTEEQLHKAFTFLILAGGLAGLIFVANISGASAVASERIAHVASNAGYEVRRIQPQGVERMNVQTVYERALSQQNLAMTQVDLHGLREELVELPWVRDARVSRQLPDTLVIDIIEREPHAVLQRPDRLMLIDASGVELEPISRANAADYLLIAGPGAQDQVEELTELLDAAPALQNQIKAAEWIGNRRWDLTFNTDQELALPEGQERAAAALISFAQADGVHRLIGGQAASFDMRNAPRMYMNVPGRSEREEVTMGEES
ncbi:cell division protein FtsQ/DivIB [Aurantiacibacter sp. D1-12]|uniref:cell division protein FtsQ/DivIB n=1 Tax=Aurantiacibacter sp. D1-12 TaxID=2993658 RepID=UPI00237C9ECA|nr:cell division protein FtsQ/DivIB [Aurantiacibacter sp. D1-12]MDE1466944.1 cell division protein FtsQ/DivIB [Aurantiacibacter sp. D1-12]